MSKSSTDSTSVKSASAKAVAVPAGTSMAATHVMPTYARQDVVFERGEGVWLIAANGDRYLDFASGVAVNALGHAHPKLIAALTEQAGKLWHTSNLYQMPGQEKLANRLIDLNLRGVMHCLDATLPVLLKQGQGAIGIVASVAGYSGLPRAMAYGATKAALINLSECLYFDLHPRGIGVYLINPGFVDTPLTADNDFPMPAMMSASSAAEALIEGVERGHFHIHFPKRFTNWLRFARLLPYRAYFALIHKVTGL